MELEGHIPVTSPGYVEIHPGGRYLFAMNWRDRGIEVHDLYTDEIQHYIDIPSPIDMEFTKDGNRTFVASVNKPEGGITALSLFFAEDPNDPNSASAGL